jgi:excinuclease ABC subunit A
MVRFTTQQIVQYILDNYFDEKIALLAPIVRGRKGHYRELFEQIRKQGFTKVRIDGDIQDLTERMQVDRYKTHDIEVVIDRMKVDANFEQRLAESIEQALKMGNGLMMIMQYDSDKVQIFSKTLMCPDTGISYQEPSPNTFSFNSPYGACPHCKGLGFVHDVSMDLVIPDNTKSINEGGIVPFGEVRENFTFQRLRFVAQKYGFTFATPVKNIPQKALDLILSGIQDEETTPKSDKKRISEMLDYEGVLNTIRRCYTEKEVSENLRQWAEGFMEKKECETCHGKRLKTESATF